jgi:hypothetical protein
MDSSKDCNIVVEFVNDESKDDYSSGATCPECGQELVFTGHCGTCYSCGYSMCSL